MGSMGNFSRVDSHLKKHCRPANFGGQVILYMTVSAIIKALKRNSNSDQDQAKRSTAILADLWSSTRALVSTKQSGSVQFVTHRNDYNNVPIVKSWQFSSLLSDQLVSCFNNQPYVCAVWDVTNQLQGVQISATVSSFSKHNPEKENVHVMDVQIINGIGVFEGAIDWENWYEIIHQLRV